MDRNTQIRLSAFQRVRELQAMYGEAIPWREIEAGFEHEGERMYLSGKARGIFRPKQMSHGVLSIKTTIPRGNREQRYDDIASEEGFFEYRFMGEDPESGDNRRLREAWESCVPLIYFHAIAPSLYHAILPAFVTGWDPKTLTARVEAGDETSGVAFPAAVDTRRYIVGKVKQRLHQAVFRELVLDAYNGRCAVSRLEGRPIRRLLHAAHILPDRDQRGLPLISNGIAMSVLHHTAYDANLIGIDPDRRIHVNRDLLELKGSSTLKNAIQRLHGELILDPQRTTQFPDRDFLGERFEEFKKAG